MKTVIVQPTPRRLSALPKLLQTRGFIPLVKYWQMREMATDGVFPAHQTGAGRWFFTDRDLPAIIAAMKDRGVLLEA
jgi:hypothetical protein